MGAKLSLYFIVGSSKKRNLDCTRGITSKRVTNCGLISRLAPGNIALKKRRSSGEPLARLSNSIGPEIEPQTSCADSSVGSK